MKQQQTAMIIEDEENIRELICYHLNRHNILPLSFDCVEKAMPYLEKADVILVNLKLPGMDGADFIRKIRKDGNYTPVVVVSGGEMPEDLKNYDLVDYVSKEINMGLFWDRIDNALGIAKNIETISDSTIYLKNFCARQSGKYVGIKENQNGLGRQSVG